MVDVEDARRLAAAQRPFLRKTLSELIAIDSKLGAAGASVAAYAQPLLTSAGLECRVIQACPWDYAGHPEYSPSNGDTALYSNLVAEPAADGRVLLFAHIDTEPVHEGWGTSPWECTFSESRCYGLGAADDKSGVAIVLAAARLLALAGAAPGVVLIHGKAGGSRGTLPALLSLRRSYRAALYVHPAETGAGLREIKHCSRGVLDIELEVNGWRGTAREIGTPQSAPFTEGGNALEECVRLSGEMRDALPAGCAYNLGTLSGGTQAGVVPESAVAQSRVLFDAPHSIEGLQHILEARVQPRKGYCAILRYTGLRAQPAQTDWNDGWCRKVRAAVEQISGLAPAPYGFHLASDLRFPIRLLGIPAVGLGPMAGAFYSPNEWVDHEDLLQTLAVTLLAAVP